MSTFVKYVDEVEISEVDLGAAGPWNSVDVSAYMQDTSAIGVTIRAYHTTTSQSNIGVRTPGALFPMAGKTWPRQYVDYAVSFGGSGNTVEISRSVLTGGLWHVYVTGEIHDDHAALHDTPTPISLSEPWETWVDQQVTPIGSDVVGDIAAAIVLIRATDTDSKFGLREKGTSRGDNAFKWESSAHWYVVGVDANGYYQIFTAGKSGGPAWSQFIEIGYIRKTGGIVTVDEPTGMGLAAQDGSYAAVDFSGKVSSEAFIVGGRWNNPDTATRLNAFLRATGSSEDTNGIIIHKGEHSIASWVGLDVDRAAEYQTETSATPPDFYVEWYEIPLVPPTITNTPAATAPAGVDLAEQMTASGSDPKLWELTVGPPGATIDSSTGLIDWVPSAAKVGDVYDFTVVVTGPELNTDTLAWQVTVTSPQLTAILRVDPALTARLETKPTQTLASRVEPALTGTTKVEIS